MAIVRPSSNYNYLHSLVNDKDLSKLYKKCKDSLNSCGYLTKSKVPVFLVSTDEVSTSDFNVVGFLYKGPYLVGDLRKDENVDIDFLNLIDLIVKKYGDWTAIVFDQGDDWPYMGIEDYLITGPITAETVDLWGFIKEHISIKAYIKEGINYSISNFCAYEVLGRFNSIVRTYAAEDSLDNKLNSINGVYCKFKTKSMSDNSRILIAKDMYDNIYKVVITF